MALPSEVKTLLKALDSLQTATTPTALASCSRTVARAADDLELVCEETVDPSLSAQLDSYIERARQAVNTARKNARAAALKADRNALIQPPTIEQNEFQGSAERLAAEINDALRATAAVVSEEIQRAKVAGDVVEESTRRLRRTTDQHGVYADGIVSGASTLKSIRRTDLVANLVLALCFALFFIAAAYVTNRRIQNSNFATFIVRPTYRIVSLPLRITSWVFRSSFNKLQSQPVQTQYPSLSDPQLIKHRESIRQREPQKTVEEKLSYEGGDNTVTNKDALDKDALDKDALDKDALDKDANDKSKLEEAQETPYVSLSQHHADRTEKDVLQHSRISPGDRNLRDKDAHDKKTFEEAQETSHVSPSQRPKDRTEQDVAQHSRKLPSILEQNINDDRMSEDPDDTARDGDDVRVEANLLEDRTKEDPQTTTVFVDDGGTMSSAPIDLPKSSSDEQCGASQRSAPSTQCQMRDDETNSALSQEVVQEISSTEPDRSRLSEAKEDSGSLNEQPFTVNDEANIIGKAQSGKQGIPDEKDLEALLQPLLSSHQFVPGEDFGREESPTPVEHRESTPERDREIETDGEQRHTTSDDSFDEDETAQSELQGGPSEFEESEPLLIISLPSQDESSHMDTVTDGDGTEEVGRKGGPSEAEDSEPLQLTPLPSQDESLYMDIVSDGNSIDKFGEQSDSRPSKGKDYESRHLENSGKGTSETENQKESQNVYGMGNDLPQPNKVTDGKSDSEVKAQKETQHSKGTGDEPPGSVTSRKDVSETVEQIESLAAQEKIKESLRPQYATGRKSIIDAVEPEKLQYQAMKDEGTKSLRSDNPTDRKGTSGTVEQREFQAKKDKEDVTDAEEKPAVLGDANQTDRKGTGGTEQKEFQDKKDKGDGADAEENSAIFGNAEVPQEVENLESRESNSGKWNEASPDISFSSVSEASESEEKGIDIAITRAGEQISDEERDEGEPHEQLPFPASVGFEGKTGVEPEEMSEKKVQYDLSRICLVSGLDSDLLEVCAIPALTHF